MSNFDRAVKALNDVDEAIDHLADNEAYVTALEAAGLLAPDVQVIRTVEELEALDPDMLVGTHREMVSTTFGAGHILATDYLDDLMFPMVIVATGEQVRAAREAMEQNNE